MVDNFRPDVLQRWVAVSWGGGIYVLVQAKAFYDHAALGTRSASITLTADGIAAGGKIIGQKVWHVEELADSSPEAHPAYTLFRAVLQFSRGTKDKTKPAYFVTLTGSLPYVDPIQGAPLRTLFCGTITSTMTYTAIYTTPNPFAANVPLFWQDGKSEVSGPPGSFSQNFTLGPLAGMALEDVGTGSSTRSSTSTSLWYQDQYGNYIDTHRPCSELPPPGGPTAPAERIEGWDFINGWVYAKAGVTVTKPALWTPEMTEDQIIVAKPNTLTPSQPSWIATVPQSVVGLNSDFGPIFDDLPSGQYDWGEQILTYENLPRVTPTILTHTFGVYSMAPTRAKYHVTMITRVPPPLRAWRPPQEPVLSGSTVNDEKYFTAGQPPPVGQTLVELT